MLVHTHLHMRKPLAILLALAAIAACRNASWENRDTYTDAFMLSSETRPSLSFDGDSVYTSWPPTSEVETVWWMPPTSRSPATPQIAPLKSIVRMMTRGTFMPI